jgi:hypothetical protein
VQYVTKSEEYKPVEVAHAMNVVVRAVAQHQLGQTDKARTAFEEATQLITRLNEDPGQKGDHNLLIAEILFHEAEALINGKPEPEPTGGATDSETPAAETPPAKQPDPDAAPGDDN